ncbi:MAG: response regulator transcription factor [Methylobacter sp.]|uniref:Response regulator transcription factor n=1 Tax=Candidatus Methylobacter titanis TaxID=3053457 RepID=A0AA43Q4Y5_9GAMM|nr:response regulator transcription factor [Candidatus Methylobacter titanis]
MTVYTPPRIAIIEDDHDLLQSTLEYLHIAGYIAWGVGNGDAFYKQLLINPVDVVMIDIGLPGEDGFSIARHLRSIPHLAIIIVSARDTLEDRLAGLNAGADRYLVKPVNLDELIANINAMVRRKDMVVDPAIEATLIQFEDGLCWRLSGQHWTLTSPSGAVLPLTAREYRLLQMLIAVQGQTISKFDIADDIIGRRIINRNERLDVLLARLRKKANATLNEPLPIKTAHMHGYAFTAPAIIQ